MKNIQKLMFLIIMVLSSLSMYTSDDECDYDDRATSRNTSLKSANSSNADIDFYDGEIGFFIEKPTITWKTKIFKNPVVVQARSFYDESGRTRLQVIEIPASIYFNYMPEVAYKDFIECNGPIGELDLDEYKELVEIFAPHHYDKLQRHAAFHAVRYKRTVIDDIEFSNL